MVTVGMHYHVLPDGQDTFERIFEELLALMQKTKGHRETRLYREVGRPDHFYILSHWDNEDAYHAFVRGEAFDEVLTGRGRKILAGRPHHQIYYP